jgi:hypothetical protein
MNYEYRLYQYRDGVLTLQKRSAQWNDANTWDGWEDVDTVFDQWLHGKQPKTKYTVKTKEDYDEVRAGSVIQDAVLDDGCYVGMWASAMGSYTTSVPEEICEVIGERNDR